MLRYALIGCGAIGSALLALARKETGLQACAVVVADLTDGVALSALADHAPHAELRTDVPHEGIDLVIETAGHAAIEQHVMPALNRGVPCIVASVGALSDDGLFEQIEGAARKGRTQVHLIAGAIGGIDALSAGRIGGLDRVCYTGRKPPAAWRGTPAEACCDLSALTAPTMIFEGSAREAARQFPKNANVAATVSLAGLGMDRTQVRLLADPGVAENVHTVEAEGAFGQLELTLRNRPLPTNPRTSALTVYSALRALTGRVTPWVI